VKTLSIFSTLCFSFLQFAIAQTGTLATDSVNRQLQTEEVVQTITNLSPKLETEDLKELPRQLHQPEQNIKNGILSKHPLPKAVPFLNLPSKEDNITRENLMNGLQNLPGEFDLGDLKGLPKNLQQPGQVPATIKEGILNKHPMSDAKALNLGIQGLSKKVGQPIPSERQLLKALTDSLSQASAFLDLPAMEGTITKEKLLQASLKEMDSLKQVKQIKDAYKLEEIQKANEYKEIIIKEKPSFLDKSYFEGTLGFSPQDMNLLQLVPTWGYHLIEKFSMGLGLDGLINSAEGGKTAVGLKSFAKWEVLPKKFYLQLENTSYFSDLSYLYEEVEAQKKNLQVPYAGAGVLIDVFKNKSLNLSLMHRFGEHPFITEGSTDAPWVFRLGMSFFPVQPNIEP